MNIYRKTLLGLVSSIVTLALISPAMGFDLGKIISNSVERSIDRTVRSTENSVTREVDKAVDGAISSVIPDLSPNAKKDDGQQMDLSKGIIIFGFDGCPHCRNAYAFMNRNKIRYQLMDTQKDKKASRVAKQNGISGVPVLFVSGEKVAGFTEASYQKIFKKHGVLKK